MNKEKELEYYKFECSIRAWVIAFMTIILIGGSIIQANNINKLEEENDLLKSKIENNTYNLNFISKDKDLIIVEECLEKIDCPFAFYTSSYSDKLICYTYKNCEEDK